MSLRKTRTRLGENPCAVLVTWALSAIHVDQTLYQPYLGQALEYWTQDVNLPGDSLPARWPAAWFAERWRGEC